MCLFRAFPATHALHISCRALFVFGLLCGISCNRQARFQQAGQLRQTIGRKGISLDELFLQKIVRIVEAKMESMFLQGKSFSR